MFVQKPALIKKFTPAPSSPLISLDCYIYINICGGAFCKHLPCTFAKLRKKKVGISKDSE
jgi:hypothetical protein